MLLYNSGFVKFLTLFSVIILNIKIISILSVLLNYTVWLSVVYFVCERFQNEFLNYYLYIYECILIVYNIYVYVIFFENIFKTVYVMHVWGDLECRFLTEFSHPLPFNIFWVISAFVSNEDRLFISECSFVRAQFVWLC